MSIGKRHGNTLFCRWNMYKERGIFRCHVHFQRVSLDITHKDRETCHMVRKTWNRVRFKLYWLFQAISSNDVFRVSNRLRFPCWTPCGKSKAESFIVCSSIWWQGVEMNMNNVGKTMITHPFGNGLYHLFMVIWGMVYYCFTLITVKGTKIVSWPPSQRLVQLGMVQFWLSTTIPVAVLTSVETLAIFSVRSGQRWPQKKRVITDVGGDPFSGNRRILRRILWSLWKFNLAESRKSERGPKLIGTGAF